MFVDGLEYKLILHFTTSNIIKFFLKLITLLYGERHEGWPQFGATLQQNIFSTLGQ